MQNLQRRCPDEGAGGATIEAAKREVLKTVAYTLLRQVYGVTEPPKVDVRQGIDFYKEVQRFEISLIQQALFYSNGKQTAAASLLNLNVTTLHSKIKFYDIEMSAIKMSARSHQPLPQSFFQQQPRLLAALSPHVSEPGRVETGNRKSSSDDNVNSSDLETLKTEVLRSMALALESKAEDPSGVPDFDVKRGLNFYKEVTNFEIKLISQALMFTNGNQRAAARLLRLKTTTLNTKVKMYRLDSASINE